MEASLTSLVYLPDFFLKPFYAWNSWLTGWGLHNCWHCCTMKGRKMQSRTEEATWASGLAKDLVIDGYGFTCSSALLNYAKPSSCCFRSTAKLSGESWGPQTGISDPWNQTPLRLPQTWNFRTDLQQQTLLNNQRGRCCSLTFSPRWRMVYFPLNFESQRPAR